MRKFHGLLLAGLLALPLSSCKDFLAVNTNPNAPQEVSANLYLAPMLHWMVTGQQFDGRFTGRYNQEWLLTGITSGVISTWDRMGYDAGSDNGAQQFRDVYWSFGQNLADMMTKAEAEQRWDLLGVGYVLKAWGWQALTDLHGEIPVKGVPDASKLTFDYDTQEYVYTEVQSLLQKAITNLKRSDGGVDVAYLAKGDKLYNGDRNKWLKFAYGLLAINLNHYSNKSTYKPADVIAAVDLSFASNADEALLAYPGTQNDDMNFLGRTRANLPNYRQTQFVVGLMNGSQFGGVVDPRMSRMLAPSPDGQYRGLDPNVLNFGALAAAAQPMNFFGQVGAGTAALPSRYIFSDKSKLPAMTYAQLQFIKAEAAYRSGDKATALAAYRNGVSAHIDWVNARNLDDNQAPTQITAAEKAAFLASPAIIPATAAALTLTQIMSQKYIAQWGWAHNEIWMDLRRYHYTDIDPASTKQVFPGFAPPTVLFPDNNSLPVQRIRTRFNSEYVWNRAALDVIGGLATDYHTKTMWIIQP